MRLITFIAKGGRSCREPRKAPSSMWVHAAARETGRGRLGVNSPDEGALRGHAQALVVQVGDTEASGIEMTFACGTKQSRES